MTKDEKQQWFKDFGRHYVRIHKELPGTITATKQWTRLFSAALELFYAGLDLLLCLLIAVTFPISVPLLSALSAAIDCHNARRQKEWLVRRNKDINSTEI